MEDFCAVKKREWGNDNDEFVAKEVKRVEFYLRFPTRLPRH